MNIIYHKSNKVKPAIFLDRDGVINKDIAGKYITSIKDVFIYKTAIDGLKKIDRNKYHLIIITNQSAIGRKLISINKSIEINNYIVSNLKKNDILINAVYFCPHRPEENCNCRKPKTGLIKQAMKDFKINLKNSIFIGDKITDMKLARDLKIKFIMVRTGQYLSQTKKHRSIKIKYIINNLKCLYKYV